MTADLVITTPFRASSVGMYKCEVRSAEALTEKIFCTLSRWQKSGALVSVDGSHYAVDSQCSLEIDSYDTEECAVKESDSFDRNILILIALPSISGLLLLICVLVVLVTAVACYHCRR